MKTALLAVFVFGGVAVGADDKEKVKATVAATVKKAKERLTEAAKGEEEETKKLRKALDDKGPSVDSQLIEAVLKNDGDPGFDPEDGKGTVGERMKAAGFNKLVAKYGSRALDEEGVRKLVELVFAGVNPAASAEHVAECVCQFIISSMASKVFFVEWATNNFDDNKLGTNAGAKALAKKFRGR